MGDNAPARVVDDLLHNSTNVTVALSVIKVAQAGGGFVEMSMCLELKTRQIR
jgi:hypothetical protein